LVRIFDTETGNQIQELRRGSDHADIYCISFDAVSKYLACSSDKGTIHIFQIRPDVSLAAQTNKQLGDLHQVSEAPPQNAVSQTEDKNTNNTKSMLWFMKGVLPKYFESEWSFA
jgi:WD repeat-containing protein 45